MVNVIDRKDIRYLNLFSNVTRIPTKYCFEYNNVIIFCVPRKLLRKAVGEDAKNLRKISEIIRKRVKVVAIPESVEDARGFIEAVISPFTFRDFEISGNEIIVTGGGSQNKAALIGRNKKRLQEMQEIIRDFFKKDFRIA